MNERNPISKTARFEVFKRDKFTCQYCGQKAPEVILHVDHMKPIADKGKNDLMNLITSCAPCNLGKGARPLNDNSILEKQRKQIEDLEEQRSQLLMLLEWRDELATLEEQKIEIINDAISKKSSLTPNENGRKDIKKWLKKFSMDDLLSAIDASFDQYLETNDGNPTSESWNKAFNMVPRIINAKSLFDEKPYMKDLFYIRAVLRNRLNYVNEREVMSLLKRAYLADIDIEELKQFSKGVSSWTRFRDSLYEYLEKYEGKENEPAPTEQENTEGREK